MAQVRGVGREVDVLGYLLDCLLTVCMAYLVV